MQNFTEINRGEAFLSQCGIIKEIVAQEVQTKINNVATEYLLYGLLAGFALGLFFMWYIKRK